MVKTIFDESLRGGTLLAISRRCKIALVAGALALVISVCFAIALQGRGSKYILDRCLGHSVEKCKSISGTPSFMTCPIWLRGLFKKHRSGVVLVIHSDSNVMFDTYQGIYLKEDNIQVYDTELVRHYNVAL